MNKVELTKTLENELPPIIFRKVVGKLIPGLSPRYLANLDCKGEGPTRAVRIGGLVAYPRDSFVRWFTSRVEDIDNDNQ